MSAHSINEVLQKSNTDIDRVPRFGRVPLYDRRYTPPLDGCRGDLLQHFPIGGTVSLGAASFPVVRFAWGPGGDLIRGKRSDGFINDSISRRFFPGNTPIDYDYSKNLHAGLLVVGPSGVQVKKVNRIILGREGRKVGGGIRGDIFGRSAKSNRRLMNLLSLVDIADVASIDRRSVSARAVFITLTYPAVYPDPKEAKKHLDAWRKRLERKHGVEWALWVLEFQRRGAVHFHLVIVFKDDCFLPDFRSWLSKSWYKVVKSGDEKHLKAGTQCVSVHLKHGQSSLMGYLAKEINTGSKKSYQAQGIDPDTGELLATGRTWGFWRKENVPFVIIGTYALQDDQWKKFVDNVSHAFPYSPYLCSVASQTDWGGCLLYGDGIKLIDKLLRDIQGVIDFL